MTFSTSSAIPKDNHHSIEHEGRVLKTSLFGQWLFDEPAQDISLAGKKHNLPWLMVERGRKKVTDML